MLVRVKSGTRIVLPSLLFFGSGALGLGYELVWIKKSALVVGASQIALSTVLTAFFLGLAAGSVWFADHVRSRRRSPLWVYGILELLIGVYALAFPWLFRLLELSYAAAYDSVAGSAPLLFALRFALLFALFLPPTFMMGGTLPLLLDGLVERDASVGRRTGLLYGINLLGAVSGVLLTGYWAIPALGLSGTSRVAALGNLLIGVVALWAFRRLEPLHRDPDTCRLGVFFPALAVASGLIAIAFQVAWARYFSLFNFNLVYITALLLAVYLLALSAGSLLVGALLRRKAEPLRIVAVCQALVPGAAIVSIDAWRLAELRPTVAQEIVDGETRMLPTLELDHDAIWHLAGETVDQIFLAPLFQVALVLFLPVLLMGTGLPALIVAATRRSAALRSVSGRLMFWNTVGAGLGGFAGGYLLLPLLGLHWTLLWLGLGSLGMSLAAQLRLWRAGSRRGVAAAAAAVLLSIGVTAVLHATREDLTRRTLRTYLQGGGRVEEPEFRRLLEGPLTTAWVVEHQGRIRIGSGAVQMAEAPLGGMVSGQVIAGHLPPIFYPHPRGPSDVLGICVGSGQTFGAMLRHPIAGMDVVDISPGMTELARTDMATFNNGLGHDPRVRFHLDDGRHFVQRAPNDAYDIVALEPPPPNCEGVHNLYSREFYEQVGRVLRPGGVFSQWLPLYFMTPQETLAAIRTATEVFPYCFLAKLHVGDYILLGYAERPTFSAPYVRQRSALLAAEWSERSLGPTGWVDGSRHVIGSLIGVTASLVLGPDSLSGVEAPAILRDDLQQLGYGLDDRWLLRRYMGIPLVDISYAALPIERTASPVSFFDPPLPAEVIAAIEGERVAVLRSMRIQDPRVVERKQAALRAERDPRQRVLLAMSLALDHDAALKKDDALRHLRTAAETALQAGLTPPPRMLRAVREIAGNHLAVYETQVSAWLASLPDRLRESALLAPLREEVAAYRERQAEIGRRYLLR
jgi:predicted membrane-bound spermidine synthase